MEASNVFLWRQQDASRNSVQMAARHHFSHKVCDGLDGKQLQEKLFADKGVNWNDYPEWAKRGTFVKHAKTTRVFTAEELEALPPKHDARKDPSLVVERRILRTCDIDLRGCADRPGILFSDDSI
jgi:tRNA(His) 5'-end guanylyltransferase